MEFSASITRACALQTIRTTYVRTYERTYAPSTVSRHSGAETKNKVDKVECCDVLEPVILLFSWGGRFIIMQHQQL